MTPWTVRFAPADSTPGLRFAVKDAIDIAGEITTAGCVAVRDRARPAYADAACVAMVRASGVRILGKTTLTELCIGTSGVNEAFGTPVNPFAPDRVPGGSSSGGAVVVAAGEVDVALGTDTGGSIRIPAACCGIAGLKTTHGRIPLTGVWPLSPTMDTVGPLARDMAGIVAGMRAMEPGFTPGRPATTVGRLRISGVDPAVESAVDAALAAAGLAVRPVELPGWDATWSTFNTILSTEMWRAHADLLGADGVSDFAKHCMRVGGTTTPARWSQAMSDRAAWQVEMTAALASVDVLALPTLASGPPTLAEADGFPYTALTAPFNVAGVPALAMPLSEPGASLQLVGHSGDEELLCATGLHIEACG